MMLQQVESPTPQALADLVARCDQINRFALQLAAAEEIRIAALASALLVMRRVLELAPIPPERLPARQQHIGHWVLTGDHLEEAATPAVKQLRGVLVLDEHEQVKILSQRSWRGTYRSVALWRDGIQGLTTFDLMTDLVQLTALAQRRAPAVARELLERAEALESTRTMVPVRPRGRPD